MTEYESNQRLRDGLETIRAGLGEIMDFLSNDGTESRRQPEHDCESEADFFEQITQCDHAPISDRLYRKVLTVITTMGYASTLVLQTRLEIDYRQAINIIAELERNGLIGPAHGFRPHKVLPTAYAVRERIEEEYEESFQWPDAR